VRIKGISGAGVSYYPSFVIDTHCHLTFPDFKGNVDEVLREAAHAGVLGAITISTTTCDCLDALAIAKAHTNVRCTSGVHPLYSHKGPHEWANLLTVAQDPKCVAWGELGLDNHYKEPAAALQRSVLAEQLAFIESCHKGGVGGGGGAGAPPGIDLPIVIHCREAFDDLIPILKQTPFDRSRFLFHCFTGTPDDARHVLDFGAMISFTGVVTYKNAPEVREAARLVPLDRIMVETDAPFLSPEPHRGKRPCRPAWAADTARALAELRAEDWDTFHTAINRNTERFFGFKADGQSASG
jgi:TatD DNase family protein